jgi:hypothetical protein
MLEILGVLCNSKPSSTTMFPFLSPRDDAISTPTLYTHLKRVTVWLLTPCSLLPPSLFVRYGTDEGAAAQDGDQSGSSAEKSEESEENEESEHSQDSEKGEKSEDGEGSSEAEEEQEGSDGGWAELRKGVETLTPDWVGPKY